MTATNLLLSIHPRHVDAMRRGEKTVELRKVRPRSDVSRVIVYETAPTSSIVGSFSVKIVRAMHPDVLRKMTIWRDGVGDDEFSSYFDGKEIGYAFCFVKFVPLPRRIVLRACRDHLPTFHPPQSYRYLDDDELRLLLRDQYREVAS